MRYNPLVRSSVLFLYGYFRGGNSPYILVCMVIPPFGTAYFQLVKAPLQLEVKVKVKVKFNLEQATNFQRGR